MTKRIVILTAVLCLCGPPAVHGAAETGRAELWPVFEYEHGEMGTSVVVRPLFKTFSDGSDGNRRVDVLYPFFKWEREGGGDMQWWLAPIAYSLRHVDPAGRIESDTAVLPIFFTGSTSDGSEDYMAVFPLGGTVRSFMGMDEAKFVLFPLYSRTVNDDYVAHSVLWPILSRGKGEDRSAWRVLPLYGERRVGDDLVYRTVLWPIYSEWRGRGRSARLVFPFYYASELPIRRTKSVIPPLFLHSETVDKDEDLWYMPWPFVEVRREEKAKVTHVWPLWGRAEREHRSSRFVAWPVYSWDERRDDTRRRRSTRVLLVGLSTTDEDVDSGVSERYVQCWPLFHWSKQIDESRGEFNFLSPIWFRLSSERFYEMYGPFWTLYRREWDDSGVGDHVLGRILSVERGEDRKRVALWPLFSYLREGEHREWELFKGLLGRRSGASDDATRLLWVLKFPDRK